MAASSKWNSREIEKVLPFFLVFLLFPLVPALNDFDAARGEGGPDGAGPRAGGAGRDGDRRGGSEEGVLKCFNCNGFGHLSRDCPFECARLFQFPFLIIAVVLP